VARVPLPHSVLAAEELDVAPAVEPAGADLPLTGVPEVNTPGAEEREVELALSDQRGGQVQMECPAGGTTPVSLRGDEAGTGKVYCDPTT
jgi:hypothetical protein